MKLQSKKARVPIAALGVTALVCAGGVSLFSAAAFAAPATIDLNSGGTSPAVGNFGTATTATANAAYALKIQDASVTNAAVALVSGPSGGFLSYSQRASNGAATTGGFTQLSSSPVSEVQTLTLSGTPASGAYTVSVGGTSTASITTYTAAALQSALNAVLGDGNDVTVALSGNVYTVTYGGSLAGQNLAAMTVTANTLQTAGAVAITTTVATTTNGSGATTAALGTVLNTDYVYVTGDVPGVYTLRLFQDTNSNLVYDAADERGSSLITLNVYDVGGTGTTADTGDDVAPVFTADSPISIGGNVVAGVTYSKALSTTDARGSGVTTGLGGRLADLTFIDVTAGGTGVTPQTNTTPTYSTTSGNTNLVVGTPSATGTINLRGDLAPISTATNTTFGTKGVVVNTNNVTGLALAPTLSTGKVIATGGAVTAKAGTPTIAYTATATGAGPAPVAGATVTFTVSGLAADVAKLTTDGTPVGTSSATSKSFTVVTNASGVATLNVTSSDPSTGSYSVNAATNGQNGAPSITTTYQAAAATTIASTNTTSDLTPAVSATSVTLKGKLLDQFGAAFSPPSSASQQVGVQVPDGTNIGFATVGSDGTFSYVYTPPATPVRAVGDTTTFDFTYLALPDSASPGGTIRYASTTAASKITLTTPAAGAKGVTLQDNTPPNAAQTNAGTPVFGNTTGEVTGTVLDSGNTGLAYKSVTLSGGTGVYFSTSPTPDATNPLTPTLDVVSSNIGVISGAYVFFTKAGEHNVIATSGTATSTVVVTAPNSPSTLATQYKITVDDINATPGGTVIVTGKVVDIFGNGVAGSNVNLSTGTSVIGALGDSTVQTNADGIFSTTFISGTNQSGTVTLTADIDDLNADPTPNAALAAAGLTGLADGDYMATGKIVVSDVDLALTSSDRLTGASNGAIAELAGSFMPGATVDIYAKESGSLSYVLADSVKANAGGVWTASIRITKSTYFIARSNGVSSPSDETQVFSRVNITATAMGKGKVRLYSNGDPNALGALIFYRAIAGADVKLKSVTSSSVGSATVTVTLPKGTRSVYSTYKAPGTGIGKSAVIKVNVK